MQEIEIEFKNLLTVEEYTRVKNDLFPTEQPTLQTNYYFETDDFQLKRAKCALRIRIKGDTYVATLKQPINEGLLETHDQLTEEEFSRWINGQISLKENIKKQLNALNINTDEIKYKGKLTTYRLEKRVKDSLVVLDHSEYHDIEDYELEIEVNNLADGKIAFEEILNKYQIEKRTTINKIERFFQTLNN